jgi:hypothetical protein
VRQKYSKYESKLEGLTKLMADGRGAWPWFLKTDEIIEIIEGL